MMFGSTTQTGSGRKAILIIVGALLSHSHTASSKAVPSATATKRTGLPSIPSGKSRVGWTRNQPEPIASSIPLVRGGESASSGEGSEWNDGSLDFMQERSQVVQNTVGAETASIVTGEMSETKTTHNGVLRGHRRPIGSGGYSIPHEGHPSFYPRSSLVSSPSSVLGKAVLTTPHRRMPAVRIAPVPRSLYSSSTMNAYPLFVTKFTLADQLGCDLRDLRTIDPKIAGTAGSASFLARKNGVIVHVGHVRAIVMRDQVLIFLPEKDKQQTNVDEDIRLIENLIDALVSHLNSVYWTATPPHDSIGGDFCPLYPLDDPMESNTRSQQQQDKSGEGHQDPDWTHQYQHRQPQRAPFELIVIDALLGHVCSIEASKAQKVIAAAGEVLSGIHPQGFVNLPQIKQDGKKKEKFMDMQGKLGELLPMKNRVDESEANCAEIASAITDVLKSDEDMTAMNLNRKINHADAQSDAVHIDNRHVEVELLFEDYLLQMDEIIHSLRVLQSSVRNTEEVVEIELDIMRNRIMRYEVLLEMSSLIVGCAAAITGLFGMNLINRYEEHASMFYQVSAFLVVLMGLIGWGFWTKLVEDNII